MKAPPDPRNSVQTEIGSGRDPRSESDPVSESSCWSVRAFYINIPWRTVGSVPFSKFVRVPIVPPAVPRACRVRRG